MTYQEATTLLFNSLPMYQRVGATAYKADLAGTETLMEWLGHPERRLRCIHVAGTNGKGSVSHMLASILMKAGYMTGLYTSPHLIDFRERIRINGQMIEEPAVVEFVERWWQKMRDQGLSFFEMTVGLAFDYFVRNNVDVAVIEVGMGGRLDSTNVITPDLSVITNIGLDHTQFLGNTLPAIASEKAGIIKSGVPVVIGETQAETRDVFNTKASECDSPITYADQHYAVSVTSDMHPGDIDPIESASLHFNAYHDGQMIMEDCRCGLGGEYQKKNIATVLAAAEVLRRNGFYNRVSQQDIVDGIRDVVPTTGLHGRWQLLQTNPTVICETAHNVDGVRAMLGKLRTLRFDRLHLVYGCVNDKDFRSILRLLPKSFSSQSETIFDHEVIYYYTRPSVPRGLDHAQLAEAAAELGMAGTDYPTAAEAVAAATKEAAAHDAKASNPCGIGNKGNDLVLATGSIFLIADILSSQTQHPKP